jgi:hypothetical protein
MAGACTRIRRNHESRIGKEDVLHDTTAPAVDVTIGGQTRIYHAFVTTAPVTLDAPSTVTLCAATLVDVIGLAAEPVPFDGARGHTPTRLVLIGSIELSWQRARYREGGYLVTPADPGLTGLRTLQQWLWQRLTTPIVREGS